jgi:hypothetical protein
MSMSEIIPLHGRMTAAEYDAERARLTATYGESSAQAAAKRDQALARLFARSGWTQQELADREGKSQDWVSLRLRFGRFLNFTTTVVNSELPPNFTERRFREFWERSDKGLVKDELRFRQIVKMLQEDCMVSAPRRHMIGQKIRERFADGKWHPLKRIAQSIDEDIKHVETTLCGIRKNQSYECKAEEKSVGTEPHWRIFKMDRAISSNEIAERLGPIVKKLEVEGKKNMATMSPVTVAVLAHDIRKLLNEWTE